MRNLIAVVALLVLCLACDSDDAGSLFPGLPAISTSNLLVTADPVIDTVCTDIVALTGTVLGGGGLPMSGQQVTFEIVPGSPSPASLTGAFNPVTALTDRTGLYTVDFTLDQQECQNNCINVTSCSLSIRATAAGQQSNEIAIEERLLQRGRSATP